MQAIATSLVQLVQERLQWPAWDGISLLHVLLAMVCMGHNFFTACSSAVSSALDKTLGMLWNRKEQDSTCMEEAIGEDLLQVGLHSQLGQAFAVHPELV